MADATSNNAQNDASSNRTMSWDLVNPSREAWAQQSMCMDRMAMQIQAMARAAETTRQAYNRVVQERDSFRVQLVSAEQRLQEVQRVLQRYAVVQDPVVASDGYTYERQTVQQYLEECAASGVPPTSQQTKEKLSEVLVPNQSLKKLVDLLRVIKPQEVAQAQPISQTASTPVNFDDDMHSGVAPPPPPPINHAPMMGMGNGPWSGGHGHGLGGGPRLHPCIRVYGFCNYKEACAYAKYPYESCLSHLKGKCRFGSQCHELHVDFKKPTTSAPATAATTNSGPTATSNGNPEGGAAPNPSSQ